LQRIDRPLRHQPAAQAEARRQRPQEIVAPFRALSFTLGEPTDKIGTCFQDFEVSAEVSAIKQLRLQFK
jgi:hypothetical protein